MNKAPWKDFAGADVHEGDVIEHPSGERGTVVFWEKAPDSSYIFENYPPDQWRVKYEGSERFSRLCLQIGDKGQAVVVPAPAVLPPEHPPMDWPCTGCGQWYCECVDSTL